MNAQIDGQTLQALLGRAIVDIGATSNAALILIGDELGLYRALAQQGPQTSRELAAQTQTSERYVREWLNAQAASGYVNYEPSSGRYAMTPEQALLFADEDSPAFVVGGFQTALAAGRIGQRLTEAFRSGEGIGWHEHDHALFHGVARFYRASYVGELVQTWIPALDGIEARLKAGGRVADIGCGLGASTIVMAKAFPRTQFTGFDFHLESIEAARQKAHEAGVAANCHFEMAGAQDFPGSDYDLVTIFDALHDMGDPAGASHHVLSALAPDGAWLIVEPYAGDRIEENFNPLGRAFYAGSTLICTPCALSQHGGMALGGQAGEARMRAVVTGAGFRRFRRAAQSPVNLVLEARP